MNNYILTNNRLRLEFEPEHGTIVACFHTILGIDLVAEQRLAENWRLMIKLPAGITYLQANEQSLAGCKITGNRVLLEWSMLTAPEEMLAITIRQHIELEGDTLTASLEVQNDSDYIIEEIYPFCIGGMAKWNEQEDWYLCWPGLIWGGQEFPFYRDFPGSYIGPARPTFAYSYPGTSVDYWQQNLSMAWTTLYNKQTNQAVYFGNHNPDVAFSAFWGELSPCASYANPDGRWGPQVWPHPSQVEDDMAIGAAVGWVFFPFLEGHREYTTPPVVLNFHLGGWWESARIYRRWFNENVAQIDFDLNGMAQWDAWHATFMASPGGRVRYRFVDLPRYAADAKQAGIRVIMLAGWHRGGIDANYPNFAEPDPRLGTVEEFVAAIQACQEMGITVLTWTNANQINLETDAYAESLHQYAIQNPHGNPQMPLGYGFDCLLNLMGYTVPRMVSGNLAHPEFRQIIMDEWEKAYALGGGAFLIDKIISGEPYHLDFNPAAPGRIESSAHQGLLAAVSEFSERLKADGVPMALETGWDRMMPYCTAIYTRYFGQDHIPVNEIVFPEVKQSCCITGDLDFGLVNKCLRFGHIIMFEGINQTGSIIDFPHLQPYVTEAIRLRQELVDNIWLSSYVEQKIAEITHDGTLFVGTHKSWKENPASGSAYTLVLNHYERQSKPVEISFHDAKWNSGWLYRPFTEPEKVTLPVKTEIPPDRFLVVIPQP